MQKINSAKFWPLSRFFIALIFLLTGCSSMPNPLDSPMVESMSTGISDFFVKDEEIVYDKEELDALKAAEAIPLKWKTKVKESSIGYFQTAYDSGALYVADETGGVTKFDAVTGQQLWQLKTDGKFSAGVSVDGQLVLIGTFKGEVLAYDDAGQMVWQSLVTSEILSPPQVYNNIVAVRTLDGRIFGLDAVDGTRKWVYQGATPSLTVRSTAGVTLAHGAAFAGFPGGKLVALSSFNGNVGWEVAVSFPRGVTELERITDITSSPVVSNQFVCSVAYQGRLGCFVLNDGTQIWSRESSSSAGLSMDKDYVYVTEEKGVVAAYDLISGAGMWKQSKLGSKRLTRPMIQGQYVIVADDQGFVNLLRNYDGTLVARSATDGSRIQAPPTLLYDGFAVQTAKGGVFVFSTNF
ncbi:MAG: outer membrane protein assembly factor BamB [Nitrosomonas sp.]